MDSRLPVYIAEINYDNEGIECISFVQYPATETNLMTFSKNKKRLEYSIIDKEKHRIIAPIMRCDFPIYRNDEQMGEYYIMYNKDTIEKMAMKMLCDNVQNKFNREHQASEKIEGVYLYQIFIKDTEKGINPIGFEDIENGSLFGVYEIFNSELWDKIINSENIGISLEGYFDLRKTDIVLNDEENEEDEDIEELFELIKKLEERIKK